MTFNLARCRGSALVTVVILSTLVGVTAAVLLRYSLNEFRLNQRNYLRFQAKNAAEAMLEYGAAELMSRIQNNANFSTSELTTAPITTPGARKSTAFAQGSGTYNNVNPTGMRFWASQQSDPTRRLIDPGDPGNEYDPLRGQYASTKIIRMLAQASATAGGVSAPSYGTQTLEIRDAHLFNYAIFYNITMEFHPGANMTIAGPVHSNKESFITASATLRFQSPFTTASTLSATPQSNAGTSRPDGQNVQFATGLDLNSDGVPDTTAINNDHNATANKIRGTDGSVLSTYVDSQLASRSSGNTFASVASQSWRGNVQDSSMGIITQNLPAITANTPAEAHDLIEPKDTTVTSSSATDVQSRETQKFANTSGLYIIQGAPGTDGAASGEAPAPVAFANSTDAAAYKAASNRTTWRTSNPTKIIALPADMVKNNRRMKDFREDKIVNTVDVDMGKLRTAVNTTTASASTNLKIYNTSTGTYSTDWNLDASGGWNGQVYVEVESPTAGYTSSSDVTGSPTGPGTRTSVRLVNGAALPNRKTITSTAQEGVTIVTNAPIYVVGNYNSPGINAGTRGGTAVGTETTATIGDPKDNEVPAAIVADAINILSNAWWNTTDAKPSGDANSTAAKSSRIGTNTEICAAFLTGNVATVGSGNNNSNYSGGVENFPRLHEDWNGTLRYRGSMIALFNSELATGQWTNASYSAPTREWGFNKMFGSQGRYPPGTPKIRTYRRLDYRDLSQTDFNALLNNTNYGFAEMSN
jgi:hypothetical protein